jgi:hypothetical protein
VLVKSPQNKQNQPVEKPAPALDQMQGLGQAQAPAGDWRSFEHRLAGKSWPRLTLSPLGPVQALIYGALCLAALELVFALAHVGETEYLMPDKVTGFTLMPNKVITQRLEGFGSFKTNSFGMQNEEITLAKPADVVRIAVFGDSYVEAMHVPRDKNFLQTLAYDLSAKLHKKVQVLNFGVSNYSVAQDYMRYQTLAKRFKPDLVIQVFRVEESDKLLPQNSRYLSLVRPVFFVGSHGELVYDDTNVRSFLQSSPGRNMVKNEWLRRNSRLWSIAGLISQNLQTFKKGPGQAQPATNVLNAQIPGVSGNAPGSVKARYISCYWYMMDKQLQCFHDECAKAGTAFMILRTPMIKSELDAVRTNDTETSLLNQTAEKIGAPILNLDLLYKKTFGLKNDGSHFLSGGHFNKAMHNWVGSQIANYLVLDRSGLVPAGTAEKGGK